MARKGSTGPERAAIVINILTANELSYSEIRAELAKDLEDPHSLLSRYLLKFGYAAKHLSGIRKRYRVTVSNPPCWRRISTEEIVHAAKLPE